ncbi:MAG: OmpA family protein, partial [Bauldia sp.]|nr:OmpA family protein [Bauldia sp.]
LIEMEGVPVREYVKQVALQPSPRDSDFAEMDHDDRRKQGPEANTHNFEKAKNETPRQFAAAAASLRQALQEQPEVARLADQVIVEETPEGLNIQLLDRDGRSMFGAGTKNIYEHARRVLAEIAPILKSLPNRIAITGHTDASRIYDRPGYTRWELSAERANVARAILAENGVPGDRFHSVTGKADSEPLFPDNAFLAANRRISILLMSEAPPLPLDHRP